MDGHSKINVLFDAIESFIHVVVLSVTELASSLVALSLNKSIEGLLGHLFKVFLLVPGGAENTEEECSQDISIRGTRVTESLSDRKGVRAPV